MIESLGIAIYWKSLLARWFLQRCFQVSHDAFRVGRNWPHL
jgi:hypothetical protein